jgi:hypothetical protein
MNNKILILILSTKDNRYDDFINNCRNTWVANARERGIRCIFYCGGANADKLKNDKLELSCDDSLEGTAYKLFRALEFIEKNNIEYTHIFRTNLSSFIFIEQFIKYCIGIPKTFYGGVIGKFNKIILLNRFHRISLLSSKFLKFQIIPYASGSGFFISKDLVNSILNNNDLKFNYIDDVMIGNALLGCEITFITRFDIANTIKNIPFDQDCYHIRLKSSNREIDAQRLLLLNTYSNLSSFLSSEI